MIHLNCEKGREFNQKGRESTTSYICRTLVYYELISDHIHNLPIPYSRSFWQFWFFRFRGSNVVMLSKYFLGEYCTFLQHVLIKVFFNTSSRFRIHDLETCSKIWSWVFGIGFVRKSATFLLQISMMLLFLYAIELSQAEYQYASLCWYDHCYLQSVALWLSKNFLSLLHSAYSILMIIPYPYDLINALWLPSSPLRPCPVQYFFIVLNWIWWVYHTSSL